jgi:hypothetical protein
MHDRICKLNAHDVNGNHTKLRDADRADQAPRHINLHKRTLQCIIGQRAAASKLRLLHGIQFTNWRSHQWPTARANKERELNHPGRQSPKTMKQVRGKASYWTDP